MRGLFIGLVLILAGFLILLVGIPLLLSTAGCKGVCAGVVWIFPLPPLVFGNVTGVKHLAHMLGVSPMVFSVLVVLAYVLTIVVLIVILVEIIRGLFRRRGELSSDSLA